MTGEVGVPVGEVVQRGGQTGQVGRAYLGGAQLALDPDGLLGAVESLVVASQPAQVDPVVGQCGGQAGLVGVRVEVVKVAVDADRFVHGGERVGGAAHLGEDSGPVGLGHGKSG